MYCSKATLLALVGLFLWLAACTGYRPAPTWTGAEYERVRVTKTDGTHVEIREAQFTADGIEGWSHYRDEFRVCVPQQEVSKVEEAFTDPDKTGQAVLGGLLVAAAAVGAYMLFTWDGPFGTCCR